MPCHFLTFLSLRFTNSDPEPIQESYPRFKCCSTRFNSSSNVAWQSFGAVENLKKLWANTQAPCVLLSGLDPRCTAMQRQIQRLSWNVSIAIIVLLCAVAQPFRQGNCTQQLLMVKQGLHINVCITLEGPLCVRPFDVINTQTFHLLSLQPSLRFRQVVNPRQPPADLSIEDNCSVLNVSEPIRTVVSQIVCGNLPSNLIHQGICEVSFQSFTDSPANETPPVLCFHPSLDL